jgi:pimeloyl-ACP methyl ester carboxylesterase
MPDDMQETVAPQTDRLVWHWAGKDVSVGYDRMGSGPLVVLFPAPSSISTRLEMRPLQERLAKHFSTLAIDLPGFGDGPRPAVDWSREAYAAFFRFVLTELAPSPLAVVAAGHSAGYALASADASPRSALCLISPTWRGPLPTMTDGARRWGRRVVRVGDVPLLGQLLYRLNVNTPVMRVMAREHVHEDPEWLDAELLAQKLAVVRASGARHASIRFVTGGLDPMTSREDFLDQASKVAAPVLMIYGAATPRKSKAEMQALAALSNVQAVELPKGKLSVHEEFPDAVAETIGAFLGEVSGERSAP